MSTPKTMRKVLNHDDKTRAKIKTSHLINRLTDHVDGKVELTASQVTAALGLIRKTLPDLAAMEVKAHVEHHTVSSNVMTEDEWGKEYGNSLETTSRPTKELN